MDDFVKNLEEYNRLQYRLLERTKLLCKSMEQMVDNDFVVVNDMSSLFEDIDKITELFHRTLKGELPQPVLLPKDYPDNEIRQVTEYANRFVAEYRALADAMSSLSRGELDFDVPSGRMHLVQSFKNLHANLRHLTWKTQQIADKIRTAKQIPAYLPGKAPIRWTG
jgi:hypothetical protein